MLSSRNSETIFLIKADELINKPKETLNDKQQHKIHHEFGKMNHRIELIVVYALVIWIFYNIFKKMKLLSDEILASSKYSSSLQKGWLFDRNIDLSDYQWRAFRESIVIYSSFAILYIIAFKLLKYGISAYYNDNKHVINNNNNVLSIMVSFYNLFHIIIGSLFIFYLHGIPSLYMIVFMLINYAIAKLFYRTKYCTILTWIYNIAIAFVSFYFEQELSSQYTISDLIPSLLFMDSYLKPRMHWNQSYRFGILRCISFNIDLYYTYTKQTVYKSPYNDIQIVLDMNDFSLIHYFAYLLYVPLQLAGPIIGFREWLIQIKLKFTRNIHPYKNELSYRNCILYFIRWVILCVIHEIMLHYYYMHYISRYGYPTNTQKRSDYLIVLGVFSYMHLKLIWLKFSVLWKFNRLWALCDEIVTVENMQRCISNTTSIIEFWKYWHSSFNVWNIRYLYIPLGGNKKNRILNTLLVFIFVFLWHGDFNLSLLFWSVLMWIAIIPEMIAKSMCSKYSNIYNNKYIVASGSALNVIILIIANNIGFGGGLDQMLFVLNEFFVRDPWNGILVFLFCYLCVYILVIVMYHSRYLKEQSVLDKL